MTPVYPQNSGYVYFACKKEYWISHTHHQKRVLRLTHRENWYLPDENKLQGQYNEKEKAAKPL